MLPHQKGDETINCNIRGARMIIQNSEPARNHENPEREFEFDKVRSFETQHGPAVAPLRLHSPAQCRLVGGRVEGAWSGQLCY
jgi:hypothetical protein